MDNLNMARQLLEDVLAIPIVITEDKSASFKSFENANCFNKELQPMNTASYLHDFSQEMEQHTIYEIMEPFETCMIMFLLDKSLVIIGPYVQDEWDTKKSEHLLACMGIPMSYIIPYELYRCRYHILDFDVAMRAVKALVEAGGHNITDYSCSRMKRSIENNLKSIPVLDNYTYEYVNQRYAAETEFIQALQSGDVLKATAALKNLTTMQQGLGHTKEVLTGSTILRTIIRIAAVQSGLSPIIVDAITQKHAQKLHSIGTHAKKYRPSDSVYEMVDELCSEIKKLHNQQHSSTVRKAIYYMQLNLGNTLSVNTIAEELHISADHLSKLFKNETGTTITNYIMSERAKKAAELLLSTKLTIQAISAYEGYTDNNYFVKVFKSQYGKTPSEYRKKYTV